MYVFAAFVPSGVIFFSFVAASDGISIVYSIVFFLFFIDYQGGKFPVFTVDLKFVNATSGATAHGHAHGHGAPGMALCSHNVTPYIQCITCIHTYILNTIQKPSAIQTYIHTEYHTKA